MYAGVGQGLMSLGQGVGNAIQTMTLEDLRKQNMQENWARQDANKADDRKHQAEITSQNREYQAGLTTKDREYQADLTKAKNVRDDARNIKTDAQFDANLESMTNKAKIESTPTETINTRNMAQAMNITEGEAWKIKTGAKQNPNQLGIARARFVDSQISNNNNYEFATPAEQEAIVNRSVKLFNQFLSTDTSKEEAPKQATAPQMALDALQKNPDLLEQFVTKYGYKPAGYN